MNTDIGEPLSLAETLSSNKKPHKNRVFHKIKPDVDNVYLPLPPFGSKAKTGEWIVKTPIHWGFIFNEKARPFVCPGFGCAMCEHDRAVKTTLDSLNKSTDPELYDLLKSYLDVHQLKITFSMNALDQKNQIGLLSIKKRMFDSLVQEERNVSKYGIKFASSSNGTWINFRKSGTGTQATFSAVALREDKEVEGAIAQVLKKSPISAEILARMESEAFDLSRTATILSFEQVKQLANSIEDYEVNQDAVDAVFSNLGKNDETASFDTSSFEGSKAGIGNDPLSKYF